MSCFCGTVCALAARGAQPSGFPKWRMVHAYFAIWSAPREGASLLEQAKEIRLVRPPREAGA